MSFADTRKAFESRLKAQLDVSEPGLAIAVDNLNFRPPVGTKWIRVSVREGSASQISMHTTPLHRAFGVCIVQVFVPENEGTEALHDLADNVAAALRGTNGRHLSLSNGASGTIIVRTPEFRYVGPDAGWFQLNVLTNYQRSVTFP